MQWENVKNMLQIMILRAFFCNASPTILYFIPHGYCSQQQWPICSLFVFFFLFDLTGQLESKNFSSQNLSHVLNAEIMKLSATRFTPYS